ncbi:hypothetical protein SLEP1_g54193 [Rubroshorea leprosula]|uniref:Disease resistance RPP13-like protein 1 n=1 Tax=Rubroshorea leprosula TaxID=152421 RepID=A0AAV5MCK9_9ROSI|nr:hypothetical protein SLEP1_g54193 [Rubroshorea leprosula]
MEVGAALASITFELLLSKLNSSVSEWVKLPEKIRFEMQNWRSLLPKIGALLEDAEEKQETDRVVKLWLADFRDLAYDMEDMLEEVEIDAKRSELIAKAKASTSKPQKLTCPKLFNKVPRFMADRDREMAARVKDITARLQNIEARISKLGLINLTMRTVEKFRKVAAERLSTTSPEHHVYGRENDKKAILKMLLTDESKDESYSIIPIVGMGGLGKTTLVRLVYNDEKLKGMFGLKAWVCISEEFDISRITRSILEQVTGEKCDLEDLSSLQDKLKEKFSGQKFLLVLDDIWNEKYELWDKLQRPFLSGAFGSTIIITTRDKNIGKMMKGTDKVYSLALLENDACVSLFARHALGVENFDAYPNLKGVGEKIVEKCKGLPLAIKTLGGLLRGKLHLDEWENILNSEIWDLPEHSSDILPAMRLSYNHLPSHLKRCFGYCSIFPKDYEFDEDELVLLWMAEGLLQQRPQRMRQTKDLGHRHFRDLLSRAFFQQSSRDESLFVMHDLMADLALYVAGETCCTLELDGKISNVNFQRARHLSLFPCKYEVSKRFEFLEKKKNLRTFLQLRNSNSWYWSCFLSNTVLQDLMKNLKCLRVLSLPYYKITKLFDRIGDLKHLRFINLSGTEIESLPDSVGYLPYLQTLLLRNCRKVSKLPTTIGNLLDLQHLDIAGTSSLKEMPSEISKLTSLVTLSKFIVENAKGPRLQDLKNLSCLQGQLSILDLQNVLDANDAKEANLSEIEGLDDLSLEWCSDFHDGRNQSTEMQVLRWLKPHQVLRSMVNLTSLKTLSIKKFSKLTCLPKSFVESMISLKDIEIVSCTELTCLWEEGVNILNLACVEKIEVKECEALDSLPGEIMMLLRLEELSIGQCPAFRMFPRGKLPTTLKVLKIWECEKLESLPEGILMNNGHAYQSSQLEELEIASCPCLKSFPSGQLPNSFKRLCINNCKQLESPPQRMLQYCTELKRISIYGGDMKSLCFEDMHGPTSLWIGNCDGLESFSLSTSNLKDLFISDCRNLKSLPNKMHDLTSLNGLYISNCPGIKCISDSGLPPNLTWLQIYECIGIKSIPGGGLFPNLTDLQIFDCQGIESIPDRGFPPNLRSLTIDCKNLKKPMQEWGLSRITSLLSLEIYWICPDLDVLPTSLTRLVVGKVENMKSIARGLLQNLNSLQDLTIKECPKLQSLPKEGLPPSLQDLYIENCPNLQSLPKEGLPSLLELIWIENCPLLKRRCMEENGDYWPLIARIPCIVVRDDESHTSSETKQKLCLCFKTG